MPQESAPGPRKTDTLHDGVEDGKITSGESQNCRVWWEKSVFQSAGVQLRKGRDCVVPRNGNREEVSWEMSGVNDVTCADGSRDNGLRSWRSGVSLGFPTKTGALELEARPWPRVQLRFNGELHRYPS